MDNYSTGTGVAVVIAAVWSLLAVGVLVWYLWAMARLFPRIGLQSRDGWIPFWNQWKLLERVGLPGWVVLLTFVGLGIVPGIMLIIAMYRLGNEYRAGVGYTVLGVFIAPLWATLFANHVGENTAPVGATRQPANSQYAAQSQAGFVPPQAPAAPSAFAAAVAPSPSAPGVQAPVAPTASPAQSWPVGLQPAVAPQGQQAPVAPQQASPLGGETEADYARLAAESFRSAPAAPLGLHETPTPFSWTAARAAQEQAAPIVLPEPVVPPVHPLAPAAPAAPAAPPAAPAAPTAAPPAAPAATSAPQAAPAAPAAAPTFAPPAEASAAIAESPAMQAPVDPAVTAEPAAVGPVAAAQPEPAAPAVAPMIVPPAPTPAAYKATGITGKVEPLPDSMLPGAAHAAPENSATSDDDQFDLDHTIVAPRRLQQQWVLELPDGTELQLSPDTVVGRRPESIDGSAVLAIADRTRTLSKSHVRLTRDGERWIVEDLNSTNGLVLLNEDGSESELMPGVRAEATERMLFGTLEVKLRLIGESA